MTYMTIEEFRRIYDEWKNSGLSVQQYCENTGFTESRFYYWKAKLKSESLPAACGSFIPVKLSGKSSVYQSSAAFVRSCSYRYDTAICHCESK